MSSNSFLYLNLKLNYKVLYKTSRILSELRTLTNNNNHSILGCKTHITKEIALETSTSLKINYMISLNQSIQQLTPILLQMYFKTASHQ